jgi:hypothetical protein
VWLVSDFVSTPIALKPQLGVQPLPLLATYVRLMMMMSRTKTCPSSLHAPSEGFSPQEVRVLIFTDRIVFYTRKITNFIFSFMNLLYYFMNRRAVILLD